MTPTNVSITFRSTRPALHFELPDGVYHVYFDPETKEVERGSGRRGRFPVLYKNSHADRGDAGHFDCRYLDAGHPKWSGMIKRLIAGFDIAAERAKWDVIAAEHERKRVADVTARQLAELRAHPEVQSLIDATRELIEAYGSDDGHGPLPTIEKAKAALAAIGAS